MLFPFFSHLCTLPNPKTQHNIQDSGTAHLQCFFRTSFTCTIAKRQHTPYWIKWNSCWYVCFENSWSIWMFAHWYIRNWDEISALKMRTRIAPVRRIALPENIQITDLQIDGDYYTFDFHAWIVGNWKITLVGTILKNGLCDANHGPTYVFDLFGPNDSFAVSIVKIWDNLRIWTELDLILHTLPPSLEFRQHCNTISAVL